MNKQEENKCYDPKRSNGRCISYNRMAEDYERDLLRLKKYKQALEDIREIISGDYELLDPQAKIDIQKLINEALKDE